MACFMPFTNRNLDIFMCVLRPTVAIVDDLLHTLKHFSFFTERLGCIHSSIFNSLHGNMLSALTNLQNMAVLLNHNFMVTYGGVAKDGSLAAKFSTGDTICFSSNHLLPDTKLNEQDFGYACFSIFQSYFPTMDGVVAGVCLKCASQPMVANFYVWKNLQSCYSFLLNNDHREMLENCFQDAAVFVKYDVYKVVYVSADNISTFQYYPPHKLLENHVSNVVEDLE
ncbi:hypothetical protein Ccrd_008600 [Cynara cardunculus var. scolymus]|uniref:DUF7392 domain-containing protein n=1 Tax=Cynara cardunculus var. scolymus TaxID=59895 RepID=A0A103XEU5_CYNCS|nr:hypothetical protein Ccrd_008600 [Cynara cardunculus var. scolymus]